MSERIGVYPGSFDPLTRGHEDIIRRSLAFADEVIVAVAVNSSKSPLFTVEERMGLLKQVFDGVAGVARCEPSAQILQPWM